VMRERLIDAAHNAAREGLIDEETEEALKRELS